MKSKKLELNFEYKEELLKMGKGTLYESLLSVIEDIDEKYIIRTGGMNKNLYELFGFKDNAELKEKLNDKCITELKQFLQTMSNNIIDSLKDKDSFISECFISYWNKNNDMNLKFNLRKITYSDKNDNSHKYFDLDFHIMTLGKNHGGGSGHSFNFHLIDSEKLDNIKEKIISSDLMECVKTTYLDYFDEASENELTIEQAKEYHIEGIKEWLRDFMYGIEDKLKNYKTLKSLNLKEQVEEYLKTNSFTKDFSEAITTNYRQYEASVLDSLLKDNCKEGSIMVDEDSLEVKFLGELIKTISKSSYTVYEIN